MSQMNLSSPAVAAEPVRELMRVPAPGGRAQTGFDADLQDLEFGSDPPVTMAAATAPLRARLQQAIAAAVARDGHVAVIAIEIDVAAASEAPAPDEAPFGLVPRALVAALRAADMVGRDMGDGFLIVLPEVSARSDAVRVSGKLLAAAGALDRGQHRRSTPKAWAGVAFWPDDGGDCEALIARAQRAVRDARQQDRPSLDFESGAACADSTGTTARHEHEAGEDLRQIAISAQAKQAAAEQAQRRQLRFLARVAHELRHPLAPIRAAAAELGQLRGSKVALSRVQALIEHQTAHLSHLVDDLLDVTSVGSGVMRIEHRRVELNAIVGDAADAFRPTLAARAQRFILELPRGPIEVTGDATRLMQVVTNLLAHASDGTQDGGTIRLLVAVVDRDASLNVSDNGIGITVADLPFVFEPALLTKGASEGGEVGIAIGLPMVRELVEAHGGTVAACSAGSGLGSLFTVTLPLADPTSGKSARKSGDQSR